MGARKGKYHRKNSNVCYVEKCAPHSHMEHGFEVGGTGQRFGGAEGETLLKCTKSLIYAYVGSAKED